VPGDGNLMLVGTDRSNPVLSSVLPAMPLFRRPGGIQLGTLSARGAAFVYPLPGSDERLALIIFSDQAVTRASMLEVLAGYLDYYLFDDDGRIGRRGYFDARWTTETPAPGKTLASGPPVR
jgi:hypothetical protein